MMKISTSKAIFALLFLTTTIAFVQGYVVPNVYNDDEIPKIETNRQRRQNRRHRPHGGQPNPSFGAPSNYQGFNQFPQQTFGFQPQFQQNTANGNAVAQNQNPFFNQNAGANTHSSNIQNPFGQFQNTGGSSISSNLANDGSSGQLSAANTDQQSFNTFGSFGQNNNAQSQSANFNPFGLQTSNSNAGTLQNFGPNGDRQQAFGSSNANEQNKFGSSNSGSQTNVEQFNENGVHGEKASSSSFSNVVNNGGLNGNFGTNSNSNSAIENGNAGAGAGADAGASGINFRRKRAADDSVVFPKTEEPDTPNPQQSTNADVNEIEGNKNSTQPEELESRFGLFGGLLGGGGRRGGQGPLGGLLRGVANGFVQGNQPYYGGGGAPYGAQYPPGAYYPQGFGGAYYPQPYYPQGFGR